MIQHEMHHHPVRRAKTQGLEGRNISAQGEAETLDPENPQHDVEVFQETDAAHLYQLILELPDV